MNKNNQIMIIWRSGLQIITVSQYHQEKNYRNSFSNHDTFPFTPPFLKNTEASTLSAGTDSGISCRWLSLLFSSYRGTREIKIANKTNQDHHSKYDIQNPISVFSILRQSADILPKLHKSNFLKCIKCSLILLGQVL